MSSTDERDTIAEANGMQFVTLDTYFKFHGYPVHVLYDNPEAQRASLCGRWMAVGEALEFMPARKAWIDVHYRYKQLRKELNTTRSALRDALCALEPPPHYRCRRRLKPLARMLVRKGT